MKVQIEGLRCSVCSYSWILKNKKVSKDALQPLGTLRLCRFCYSYEKFVRDMASRPQYNPFDMTQWTPRFVPKELFYCCVCKRNVMEKHRLSGDFLSTVTVFGFIKYPLHTLCRACFMLAVGGALPHVCPEFCCRPNPSNTVTIVTKAYTMVRGSDF